MSEVTKAEALEDLAEIEGAAGQVETLFRVRFLASVARIRRYIEQSEIVPLFPECATTCDRCEQRGVVRLDGVMTCLGCGAKQEGEV